MTAGSLADTHELSARARQYANAVVDGGEWPLDASHVDLDRLTFETSTRMKRKHGVCVPEGGGACTIRLSERTYERAGFEAMMETIRHELVHAYQQQTDGVAAGHGESFRKWVDRLDLSGRCSDHFQEQPEDYKYRLYCTNGCGFVGGRYRWSVVVRRAIQGGQICAHCESGLRVEGPDGRLTAVPDRRQD